MSASSLSNDSSTTNSVLPDTVTADHSTVPTPTPTQDLCVYIEYIDAQIILIMIFPAIGVLLLMSFFKQRKNLCRNVCWGRPHLIYPVNFIDDYGHRFVYACVFILITYKVLLLFEGYFFFKPKEFDDPEWLKKYGWSRVFLALLNTAILVIVYYPFLACISLRRMIVANILGLMYMCPWLWYFIEMWKFCPAWKRDQLHSEVTHRGITTARLMPDIPVIIAFLSLIISYTVDLIVNIYRLYLKKYKTEKYEAIKSDKHLKDPQAVVYTKELMKKIPKELPASVKEKIVDQLAYSRMEGFHYSKRVICTMAVGFVGLLKLTLEANITLEQFYPSIEQLYDDYFLEIAPMFAPNLTDEFEFYKEYVYISRGSIYFGIWGSFILHIVFMVHMVLMYRKHMMLCFKGDRNWHYEDSSSPPSMVVASLRYSGYQVAYIVYGYIILGLLLTVLAFAFGVLICLPIKYRYINFVVQFLIDYWPTLLVTILIMITQTLVAKFVLLQDYGKYLALNNRRFFHILNLFLFFYNFLVGLFSCLRRILTASVIGILLISRLDRCLLMRGFEQLDAGFKAYLGMLELEAAHNNPVMTTFIHILWTSIEKRQSPDDHEQKEKAGIRDSVVEFASLDSLEKGHDDITLAKMTGTQKKNKRWRNKWIKAWTLINNPSLHLDLLKDEVKAAKKNKHATRNAVIDSATTVVAGVITAGVLSEGGTKL